MPMITPAPRIGKFIPGRKKPAEPKNSERQPANARFHVASGKPKAKRKMPMPPMAMGLINR